jgi:IMP cyclohydrolase
MTMGKKCVVGRLGEKLSRTYVISSVSFMDKRGVGESHSSASKAENTPNVHLINLYVKYTLIMS